MNTFELMEAIETESARQWAELQDSRAEYLNAHDWLFAGVYAPIAADPTPAPFAWDTNDVIVMYTNGLLQITVARKFGTQNIKAFNRGCTRIPGVKSCSLDDCAPYSEDYTCFVVSFRPGMQATRFKVISEAAKLYAESFLRNLQPEPMQTSLF